MARDLGIRIGTLPPGPTNSIVDVAHVRIGHVTVWFDEPRPPEGRGIARTGVTAIVPFEPADLFEHRVPVGVSALNGAGEMTGFLQAGEWGSLETPVLLTRTMGVGRVYDGVVEAMLAASPEVGVEDVVIPTVGECDDSWLSDGRSVQVEAGDAVRAIAEAKGPEAGPVAEGAVGAGTGMVCLGFKGGIGSASRDVTPTGYRLGALVLANFGDGAALTVDGVPAGREFVAGGWRASREEPEGSCIVVLATDAPLSSRQLSRLATRAGLGLARTGSVAHHGSGEIFLAFSTGAADVTHAGLEHLPPEPAARRGAEPVLRRRGRGDRGGGDQLPRRRRHGRRSRRARRHRDPARPAARDHAGPRPPPPLIQPRFGVSHRRWNAVNSHRKEWR